MKVLASNKKAYFNFDILESFEAGIVLVGWEVKSIKQGRISLEGAYLKIRKGELFLVNSRVARYKMGVAVTEKEQNRERKLLMHRKQILGLEQKLKQSGTTMVPLEVGLKNGLIKVTVALVKGRKRYDKRAKLKEREIERKINADR